MNREHHEFNKYQNVAPTMLRGEAPRREGEIPEALAVLQRSLADMHVLVDRLIERTEPVRAPKASSPASPLVERNVESPLARSLYSLDRDCVSISHRLTAVLEELEL